ncbi:MAG: HAMP domain-containing protein, partial [Myxococcota bacterium]
MATVDRNHDLRRAQRRFSLRFGLAIALTGLPFLFLAGFVVRPIVVRNFKEHLVEELAVPIVEATAVATQGRPPLSTQVILHNRKLRLWTTLGDQTVELGEFDLPGEQSGAQLIAAFIICSGIGVASALAFAWPWTRRLRRVVQAFGAVGHSGGASKIEVTSNDVIGQIALGFNEMVERIEGSLEEREALIQAVSHELATPLSRMRLLLSIGDEVDRVALRHELTELEALAEELVAYVEQDTCRALEREGCDAMDVTRQTTETHRNWTRKDLGFESDVEAARVVGDERSLERCVANLLRNAERHAR